MDEAGQVQWRTWSPCHSPRRIWSYLATRCNWANPFRAHTRAKAAFLSLITCCRTTLTHTGRFGIFLPRTWRLHPSLCNFISEAVYEGRLGCETHTAERALDPGADHPDWLSRPAGLIYIPVEHEATFMRASKKKTRSLTSSLTSSVFGCAGGRVLSISSLAPIFSLLPLIIFKSVAYIDA